MAHRNPSDPGSPVRSHDMAGFVHVHDRESVRTVIMSNPGRMNAAPAGGWRELAEAFEAFTRSDQRVLVLTGDGNDFCAGADMNKDKPERPSAAENAARMKDLTRAATALHRTPKPTIAAVDGVAVGAGMNIAIGCDLVIATERARFAEVFVKRGLTLDFGGTWLLPRLVGLTRPESSPSPVA